MYPATRKGKGIEQTLALATTEKFNCISGNDSHTQALCTSTSETIIQYLSNNLSARRNCLSRPPAKTYYSSVSKPELL